MCSTTRWLPRTPLSTHTHISLYYGVAGIGRLLKIIRLFGRISSLFKGSFAKETCNFKEPSSRSHPIPFPHVQYPLHETHVVRSYIQMCSTTCCLYVGVKTQTLLLSHTHTHTHTHTHIQNHIHTHKHTHKEGIRCVVRVLFVIPGEGAI